MKTPDQWLKERCVPEGPLWDKQPSWKEWIEAIQAEAFNEGFKQSHRMLGRECVEEPISSLLKKPLAKSQEGVK